MPFTRYPEKRTTLSRRDQAGSSMRSKLNIARNCIYVAVLLWTVICLAIAAHFQNLLIINDLTRFVPYAIFASSASLFIILVLLGSSALYHNLVSTRVELGSLGMLGTFWLALGAYLASSSTDNADVECFSSSDLTTPVDVAGFSTEAYQAQYRVLEAFSLFNVILVWSFLLFLLAVAVKHHRQGHTNVWTYPVTKYHVFKSQQLPRYNQQTRGRTTTKKSHGDGFLRNASPREDARAKMRHHSRRRDDKSPGPREPSRRPSRVRR